MFSNDLEKCKHKWNMSRVVGEDFNMGLSIQERTENSFSRICAEEFKETIERLDLVDLPLTGGK